MLKCVLVIIHIIVVIVRISEEIIPLAEDKRGADVLPGQINVVWIFHLINLLQVVL
jgi:hypothetical protein